MPVGSIYAILGLGEVIGFAYGENPAGALDTFRRGDDALLTKWDQVPQEINNMIRHPELENPTITGGILSCEGVEVDLMDRGEDHPNPTFSREAPVLVEIDKVKLDAARLKMAPPVVKSQAEEIAELKARLEVLEAG